MKEFETIKDYRDRLINIANRVRLLGSEFFDSRMFKKTSCKTMPKRFEATITTFENTRDFQKITLVDTRKKRRSMREE